MNIPERILIVADSTGIKSLMSHIPSSLVCGIVGAINRPQYHHELNEQAIRSGIPFLVQPRRVDPEFGEFVSAVSILRPDILLCYSYSMLLPSEMINSVTMAAINIHGGLLPEYRGCSPIQWAIINGDDKAGATMHLMNNVFDGGDIIGREECPIFIDDTWMNVRRRVNEVVDSLLVRYIPDILSGTIIVYPQDESQARHWPRRHPEDGLIDFSLTCRKIYNLIRALVAPLPGAYYIDKQKGRIIINRKKSLWEVVRLKSAFIDIAYNGVTLRPRSALPDDSDNVIHLNGFLNGQRLGSARVLYTISPREQVIIDDVNATLEPSILVEAIRKFSRNELELENIEVC